MSPQAPAAYPQLPHNVESVEQPCHHPPQGTHNLRQIKLGPFDRVIMNNLAQTQGRIDVDMTAPIDRINERRDFLVSIVQRYRAPLIVVVLLGVGLLLGRGEKEL